MEQGGGLNGGEGNDTQAHSTHREFDREVLRTMWEYREIAETSPDVFRERLRDSLPSLSHGSTYLDWNVGRWLKEDEELRHLWEAFYADPQHEAQSLFRRLSERSRTAQRDEAMASRNVYRGRLSTGRRGRVNQLRALGNSVSPQQAYPVLAAIAEVLR
jgi:hypothetical protein